MLLGAVRHRLSPERARQPLRAHRGVGRRARARRAVARTSGRPRTGSSMRSVATISSSSATSATSCSRPMGAGDRQRLLETVGARPADRAAGRRRHRARPAARGWLARHRRPQPAGRPPRQHRRMVPLPPPAPRSAPARSAADDARTAPRAARPRRGLVRVAVGPPTRPSSTASPPATSPARSADVRRRPATCSAVARSATSARFLEQIGDAADSSTRRARLRWGWCEYLSGHYAQAAALARHRVRCRAADASTAVIARRCGINLALGRGDVASALECARERDRRRRSAGDAREPSWRRRPAPPTPGRACTDEPDRSLEIARRQVRGRAAAHRVTFSR